MLSNYQVLGVQYCRHRSIFIHKSMNKREEQNQNLKQYFRNYVNYQQKN